MNRKEYIYISIYIKRNLSKIEFFNLRSLRTFYSPRIKIQINNKFNYKCVLSEKTNKNE